MELTIKNSTIFFNVMRCFSRAVSLNGVRIQPKVQWTDASTDSAMSCDILSFKNELLSINHRFWGKENTQISALIGYFIWKNIDTAIAKRWRKYPIYQIAKEDCIYFFLKAFKTI